MKLLYVENALAIHGGIERVITDKLNWLAEYGGCEICLLLASQGDHPIVFPLNTKVECHNLGISFHHVYQYSGLKRYRLQYQLHQLFRQRMSEKIRAFKPDVIVCTRLEFVCDVMKVCEHVPVVYESHNVYLAYKFEKYSWQQKIQVKFRYHALKKVRMIVALSQGDALEWKKLTPHVRVIPNVVHLNDTGRYSTCSSKSAVFVGRYSSQKDIQSLLQIWKLVNERHPDWQLHIFGGYGKQKDSLLFEINQQRANIIIHQPTSSINEEYFKSSMLLMTSLFEPFGLVLAEAMSCGLPVVAYDCPYGPADIISDGVDGMLINNRNVNEYVEKVCQLIENEELRREMGHAGIHSSQRYSASSVMPLWVQLFRDIINR